MTGQAPPGVRKATQPSSPPPPPSPPSERENLRCVTPESGALLVESAIGQYVHPVALQVVVAKLKFAMIKWPVVTEETSGEEMNRAASLVAERIAEYVDHRRNPGLVSWIAEPAKHRQAIAHLKKLRLLMDMRDGNRVRSEFQDFLVCIMDILGILTYPKENLSVVCQRLMDYLPARLGGEYSDVNFASRHVNSACRRTREITNIYSHPPAQFMTNDHLMELCGSFQLLGKNLPMVASYKLPSLRPEVATSALPAALLMPPPASDSIAEKSSPTAAASTKLIHTSPVTTLSSSPQSARGWESISSEQTTPPTSPPGKSLPSLHGPPTFPLTSTRPTQAALDAAATYKYFSTKSTVTGMPLVTPKMFKRTCKHATLVPKATLCDHLLGHDSNCDKSHSYLEAMSYSPLIKLSKCRQPHHVQDSVVTEKVDCVSVHVDTGIYVFEKIFATKITRCGRGVGCKSQTCIKSHSFEEVCWYNSDYKTRKCDPAKCCHRPPIECLFAHEGELVRDPEYDGDYVGKNVSMHFIERTHKTLADALDALRFLRSSTP